jgi:hypothetical protein
LRFAQRHPARTKKLCARRSQQELDMFLIGSQDRVGVSSSRRGFLIQLPKGSVYVAADRQSAERWDIIRVGSCRVTTWEHSGFICA